MLAAANPGLQRGCSTAAATLPYPLSALPSPFFSLFVTFHLCAMLHASCLVMQAHLNDTTSPRAICKEPAVPVSTMQWLLSFLFFALPPHLP